MTALPKPYAFLANEPGPLLLQAALREFGTLERPGTPDNPKIVGWADEVAKLSPLSAYADWAADFYNDDAIPWCGLFMAVIAARTAQGRPERLPPRNYLAALGWAAWGSPVAKADAMLGDVLVFIRAGGGHVGLYVGEDAGHYHVLGGNQGDAVSIVRLIKSRLYAVRRPPYQTIPANVRRIIMAAGGPVSTDER